MSWLLQVAAVALLTVLADVVLPSGQINKYVKGMMAILLLIVLVSPLVALVRQDVDLFDLLDLDLGGYEIG
ncbi:MAG: stage III sporulation protein AF [Clostridia bacterium]|nr:stage III sporulation protein AF [Clostridia bacterium]